jgi:hypothetical protein
MEQIVKCRTPEEIRACVARILFADYREQMTPCLVEAGFTPTQVGKFFRTKVRFKNESLPLKGKFIANNSYPKDLFADLSICYSHRGFDAITERWGIGEDFAGLSLPRKVAIAEFIAKFK